MRQVLRPGDEFLVAADRLARAWCSKAPRAFSGFKPNWQPEDHRSFFTAPEGWGLFVQQPRGKPADRADRSPPRPLRLRELVFELPDGAGAATATVTVAGRTVPAAVRRDGNEVRLALDNELLAAEGETLEVAWKW